MSCLRCQVHWRNKSKQKKKKNSLTASCCKKNVFSYIKNNTRFIDSIVKSLLQFVVLKNKRYFYRRVGCTQFVYCNLCKCK